MKSSEQDNAGTGVVFKEHVPCTFCGRFGAFEIGHQFLCPNCYESCGSCCPEFGQEDLEARSSENDRDDG